MSIFSSDTLSCFISVGVVEGLTVIADKLYLVKMFNLYNRNCLVAYSFKKTKRGAVISILKEYL